MRRLKSGSTNLGAAGLALAFTAVLLVGANLQVEAWGAGSPSTYGTARMRYELERESLAAKLYAQLLVQCLNGGEFTFGKATVGCSVTHLVKDQ